MDMVGWRWTGVGVGDKYGCVVMFVVGCDGN